MKKRRKLYLKDIFADSHPRETISRDFADTLSSQRNMSLVFFFFSFFSNFHALIMF